MLDLKNATKELAIEINNLTKVNDRELLTVKEYLSILDYNISKDLGRFIRQGKSKENQSKNSYDMS